MKPTHRNLRRLKRLSDGAIVLADSYAIWEDLRGEGELQPISSMQTLPSFDGLKVGQGWNGYVLVEEGFVRAHTSMNNWSGGSL